MTGWFKHSRNLFERPWVKGSPKMVMIYEYLHSCAYVQDQKLRDVIIRRGSCPTSRAAIMEGTGLSEYDVKTNLRKLLEAGEIILKTSNLGTIVTICDYDGYEVTEDLFEGNLSSGLPSGLPNQLPSKSPTYKEYKKEEERNIRSLYNPSNRRESKSLAYEIKKIYNTKFEGRLPEWKRLSDKMADKVAVCIERYGRQSVDMVFDQVLHEKFSLGRNTTGFVADFDFIFRLEQYERYLSRYELRHKKVSGGAGTSGKEDSRRNDAPQKSTGSWIDAYNENKNWKPEVK